MFKTVRAEVVTAEGKVTRVYPASHVLENQIFDEHEGGMNIKRVMPVPVKVPSVAESNWFSVNPRITEAKKSETKQGTAKK